MKIAFYEIEGWEEKFIKEAFPNEEILLSKDKITPMAMPEGGDYEVISVFVNSHLDKAVLDKFPKLKCVTTRSTGYDHIDLAECKNRGIAVLYVPGYGDNTVAEFAFGLILNLTRKMFWSIDRIKETGTFNLEGLRGMDIKGKNLGVVGTGRIGKEAMKIGRGFGMNVIAYDPYPDTKFAAENNVTYMSLEDLLKSADVITVHCPYMESTHHLINANNVGLIKRGAYLVNTARGAIVETGAILTALKDGTLAGFGADVLEEEGEIKDEMKFLATGHPKEEELRTLLQDHMLIDMPNVLITPHNAFNSQEALERILGTTIQDIQSFIAGSPINIAK